ncbi:MAG: tRNA uridine-5-carboxymethylaminomethyl(34) synthesis GTPase MnmE [Hyphomonadaceae bacterium]
MKPDTIVALASGAGRAGVALIRVSGPQARDVLKSLIPIGFPRVREATFARFIDQRDDSIIDEGVAIFFQAPASFTGEDVAELHVHGGPAVVAATIEACLRVEGVRLAEAGEFARRAFEHGKLDLAQAEGLADLVDAETEAQRRQALRQMRGALSELYEGWRARLIEAAALIEAEIDFPDEDLPGALAQRAGPILTGLAADMAFHLADARGERVRDGYRVAIIGPPNAGKSSLLNALARREAAIVSDIPGTTRDVVEVRLVLAGFPVWIADTAGLREAADAIEAEGVRRALARAEEADLRIALVESGQSVPAPLAAALKPGDVLLRSKADLGPVKAGEQAISVRTGVGIAALEALLAERVAQALGDEEAPALTRARHRRRVEEAKTALERAVPALNSAPELAAEDVRAAAHAVGRLTGRIDVEELLGEIFASFCIGK